MNHRATHPVPVEDCFGCKLLAVNITPTAIGRTEPMRIEGKERMLRKDLDAYKRLRHDGLQPRKIDGSADAEYRVNGQWDFDLGRHIPRSEEQHVREAMEWGKEVFKDYGADSLARP